MRNIVYVVGVVLLIAASTSAQMEGNPANWCREGFFTRDSKDFKLAIGIGGRLRQSHFYKDDRDDCPGSPSCRAKAYIVGGDEVLINRSYEGFSCAWYRSTSGRSTVGWIRTSDLVFVREGSVHVATIRDWLGEWTYGENGIEFTENKLAGNLNVTGTAIWKGIGDNVHVGEIDGRYEPQNGLINYSDGDDEYDCKATLRLLGKYLIVSDNLKCGGVNVSFSGIYTRKGK